MTGVVFRRHPRPLRYQCDNVIAHAHIIIINGVVMVPPHEFEDPSAWYYQVYGIKKYEFGVASNVHTHTKFHVNPFCHPLVINHDSEHPPRWYYRWHESGLVFIVSSRKFTTKSYHEPVELSPQLYCPKPQANIIPPSASISSVCCFHL
jgi:hypothetical protein